MANFGLWQSERVIPWFWSTPGSVSALQHERRPVSSMLIPLIGVFLSQSRSHCSPRLYPVAFHFIILFCLLVIQKLNDTREAFFRGSGNSCSSFDVSSQRQSATLPPPLTGPTSDSLHYDTFADKVFWEAGRTCGASVLIFLPLSCGFHIWCAPNKPWGWRFNSYCLIKVGMTTLSCQNEPRKYLVIISTTCVGGTELVAWWRVLYHWWQQ